MQVGVCEFLEKVSKLKTNKEKIEALKANDSYVLRVILQGAFDPAVEWNLPEGSPNYKPNELVDIEGVLINEARKLQYFVKGFHDNLPDHKRQRMFVDLLENVDKNDAKLLLAIKEKRLPFKEITFYHAYQAMPDLFPNVPPPAEEKEEDDSKTKSFREEATIICPHCGVAGKTERMMKQYHFDNCKKKPVEETIITNDVIEPVNELATQVKLQPELVIVDKPPQIDQNGVYQATDLSSLQEFKS